MAAGQGAYERAARLSAVADRLREGMKSPLPPSEVDDYRTALQRASAALTPEQFDAARAEARSLDLDVGIDMALRDGAALLTPPAAVVDRQPTG